MYCGCVVLFFVCVSGCFLCFLLCGFFVKKVVLFVLCCGCFSISLLSVLAGVTVFVFSFVGVSLCIVLFLLGGGSF